MDRRDKPGDGVEELSRKSETSSGFLFMGSRSPLLKSIAGKTFSAKHKKGGRNGEYHSRKRA